jgi:hypothetical protein
MLGGKLDDVTQLRVENEQGVGPCLAHGRESASGVIRAPDLHRQGLLVRSAQRRR